MVRKILLIGLDCASPRIVFNELYNELPNLKKMITEGIHGKLTSCHPPITIPAWMVMVTGREPGSLGLYGFRHRKGFSYNKGWIANAGSLKAKTVWDYIGDSGKKVTLVGVPPSYPPKAINGNLVSCFITPGIDRSYTYPEKLQEEIEDLVGEYMFDVEFRTENRDKILNDLYKMTDKRFKVIEYLISKKPWDLFMFVEIGVDRVHHAFWKYYDKEHPKYEPGNKYENVIPEFYFYIDKQIGKLLELVDDDTVVLVASDHGVKGMYGCFCINQWLIEQGYLVLKNKPRGVVNLEEVEVDWSRTKAWGWGGYYARIFLNVQGREPCGIIPPEHYENEREKLIDKLVAIKDQTGTLMNNNVFKPEELYKECKGDPSDLMVYFNDLRWRSAGTIGHESLYLSENDTGPDDAVHDYNGIFILYDPGRTYSLSVEGANLLDIAPTILHLTDLPVPSDMTGRVLLPEFTINNGLTFTNNVQGCFSATGDTHTRDATLQQNWSRAPVPGSFVQKKAFFTAGKGCVIWLTGLSGAGKSTLARKLCTRLREHVYRVEILDGDEVREALSPGLGFSKDDREQHNRRVIYLSNILSRNGVIVIVPLISPYRQIRDVAREQVENFLEVWVKCSLTECIRRDPKELYKKALAGEISNMTGLQDPYEEPVCPELILDTEKFDIDECVELILEKIESEGYLNNINVPAQ